MNKRSNMNLGEEIVNIVQDAVNNRDFHRLNRDIGNVVNGALDEVRRSIDRKRQNYNHRDNQTWNHQQSQEPKQPKYQYSNMNYSDTYRQGYGQSKPIVRQMKYAVPVGQVSGILCTVFGTIGSSLSGLAILILTMVGNLIGQNGVLQTISLGLLPCFFACIVLCMNGSRIRKRIKRFHRYLSQMHGRNYCLIKDFSSVTGFSNKATVKDLRKMIAIGMFPEGHIDDKKTCFMLNSESYDLYLKLQENMRLKDLEEQAKKKEKASHQDIEQNGNSRDDLKPEIRKAIDDGRQFVQKIKNANIALPGEEISRKLDRLEEVTGKIYDYVETHPEKFPEIRKFTEYFLPTTLKLLDAYREFDYQPVEGANIASAKKEIEDTMDTINLAFENLLDGLFEDVAMDISTDISVLETMLAQEGLTEKNIKSMGE